MTQDLWIVAAPKLEAFCVDVFTKVGVSAERAAIVAESLVLAEARGVYSHGVVRLEGYVQRIEAGVMKMDAPVTTEMDADAVALLNANNTLGQVAGHKAMALAIAKARQYGVGVVAVKNSNHFGIAGYYAMMALPEDMVGCVITNSSPAMAVYGTKPPLIGTNPLAVAIPAGERLPIVLDMSTSVVARGKIRYAAVTGHAIPAGWARDQDGMPTQDAKAALKGTLEPAGGYKGSGLSLVIDLICGVLTNTILTGGVKALTDTSGQAMAGHFFCALDLSRFIDPKLFKAHMDQVIDHIKGLPLTEKGTIFMPGEIEFNHSQKRMAEGIPLKAEVVQLLNKVAARYGAALLEAIGS